MKEEGKLVLYALYMQAKEGECEEPKPWGWNVVESAKWNSWKALEKMDRMEAMRLYVKALEEEVPKWFQEFQSENSAAATVEQSSSDIPLVENGDKVIYYFKLIKVFENRS